MRLIDADELKIKLGTRYGKLISDVAFMSELTPYAVAAAFTHVDFEIENTPTVVEGRPKGKWLVQEGSDMVEDGIVCQNCGRYIHDFLPLKPDICTLDFEKELVGGFTFCPNCGADMREEDQ